MNESGIGSILFLTGLAIGLALMGGFLRSCNSIEPYQMDAVQIHLVKTGHGQWLVNPDGSTTFSLDSIIYPTAIEGDE